MGQDLTSFDPGALNIQVEDTPPAECSALFHRAFGGRIPDFPLHYVARYRGRPVGYYHITRGKDYALIGGLCVAEDFRRCKIASRLVHAAHAGANGIPGFFGYCGSPASYKLLTEAGYRDTDYPYIIVHWTHPPGLSEKQRITADVAKLGPF